MDSAAPKAIKRIAVAMVTAPTVLSSQVRPLGVGVAGTSELERLVVAGLSVTSNEDRKVPQLGEAVPSVENGLWRVLPDGRMTTTWNIKPNAVWHDGTPVTTDDLLFTLDVVRDREVASFRQPPLDLIESAEAEGPHRITVTWKQPFINADALFDVTRSAPLALPRPKHLLGEAFLRDRASFTSLPYWNEEFVGTGPFKVARWQHGQGVLLHANDQYVLGRPQIDEIDLKFIPDQSTLTANLLAGTVDTTLGRTVSLDQALEVKERWKEGTMAIADLDTILVMYPQLLTPSPAIVGDARFRRALLSAIDRQEMVDVFQFGYSRVGDSYLSPNDGASPVVSDSIVRYVFDPRGAAAAVEALGYSRGPDGMLRDAAGVPLGVEIRTTRGQELQSKVTTSTADFWQRIGVATSMVFVPPELADGREYRATMPGFDMKTQPADDGFLGRVYSNKTPLPENNFVGNNYNRFMNPEFDALLDKYFTTIPTAERAVVHRQILRWMTEDVLYLTLMHFGHPLLSSQKVVNLTPGNQGWNAQSWRLQGS
jgi:peptide/nickel transport system substrate-binding protein